MLDWKGRLPKSMLPLLMCLGGQMRLSAASNRGVVNAMYVDVVYWKQY